MRRYQTLITASEVRQNLDNDNWVVIDSRFYLDNPNKGEADYLKSHIPGSVYAHLDRDLSGPKNGHNGRHPLPNTDKLASQFSFWGIDSNIQVVVYDTSFGQIASRLWWLLRYLGHESVAVLDGGLRNNEDFELSGGREQCKPRVFKPKINPSMVIDLRTLQLNFRHLTLIDARSRERFRGEVEPIDPIAGHIPGAYNHPSIENLDEHGYFLSRDSLQRCFDSLFSAKAKSNPVSYCGSGVTACHNLLAMEVANIQGVRLYPGSWSEWCSVKSDTASTKVKIRTTDPKPP